MDALNELGEKEPWKHVIVLRENAEKFKGGARRTPS